MLARRAYAAVLAGFGVWALINTLAVSAGVSALPGISLALGLLGACAVVTSGVLLSKFSFAEALRYCGENSIVIYLAFTLFMSATRIILLKLGQPADLGIVSLLCTAAGITGPLVLFWAVRATPLRLLFKRPVWARLPA